jgi:hypothetical protein
MHNLLHTIYKTSLNFRVCAVVNDRLYVIGGQEGDFMAKPGSPIFKCSRRKEVRIFYFLFSSQTFFACKIKILKYLCCLHEWFFVLSNMSLD